MCEAVDAAGEGGEGAACGDAVFVVDEFADEGPGAGCVELGVGSEGDGGAGCVCAAGYGGY